MKEFETVENNEYVPQDQDVLGCLRVAQSLPVASSALAGEVYFLNGNQDGYTRSHTYRCELDSETGVYTWVDQNLGKYAVGNCKNIKFRTMESGGDLTVIIAWEDPDDEAVGKEKVIWAKTALIWRKDHMPLSLEDGNVAQQGGAAIVSTVRNSHALFGPTQFTIPGYDSKSTYYFKLFPVTTENVVNNDDLNGRNTTYNFQPTADKHPWYKDGSKFLYNTYHKRVYNAQTNTYSYEIVSIDNPEYFEFVSDTSGDRYEFKSGKVLYEQNAVSMNWAAVRDAVSSGAGPDLFPVGTVFTLPHHADFGEMDFEVVSHNTESLADATKKYSMTLAALHAPQWWDRVKDDNVEYGAGMSYDYGIATNCWHYKKGSTDHERLADTQEYTCVYYDTPQMKSGQKSRTNKDGGLENYELAVIGESGHIRSDRKKADNSKYYRMTVEAMADAIAKDNDAALDIFYLFSVGDKMSNSNSKHSGAAHTGFLVDCPYKTRYDNNNNAWEKGPKVGPSSIPGTALFVNSDFNNRHEDSFAMKQIREKSDAVQAWDDTLIVKTGGFYESYPTSWDSGKFFFPDNNVRSNMLIPVDKVCEGANSSYGVCDQIYYKVKYFVPTEPLIRRGVSGTGANKKFHGDHLQNVMVTTPFLEHFATTAEPRTCKGDKVDKAVADTWRRRYHTFPAEAYATTSNNKWPLYASLQIAKDFLRIPTQDDIFMNHKRYWVKTYRISSAAVDKIGTYYKADTSRSYTDVNGKTRNYMRRTGVPTSGGSSTGIYATEFHRLFSAIYKITSATYVSADKTNTKSVAVSVFTLNDEWGGGVGMYGGACHRYIRSIIQPGGKIPKGTYELVVEKVTSGTWGEGPYFDGTNMQVRNEYYEFVDNAFVQLRSNKRHYSEGGTPTYVEEAYIYDYKEGDNIADYLFTPGTYIPILNDVPRYVQKGSNKVWTYDDGTHKCSEDCWGNTLTDNTIPTAFSTRDHYAYRLHGYPTNASSTNAWDVAEIYEGAVTSYDFGATETGSSSAAILEALAQQEYSGMITQIYWKVPNMTRVVDGDERWATSCLRQYLNGPFDANGRPIGYKCDVNDPQRYNDFGVSPIQQYTYSLTTRRWETLFDDADLWYHSMPSLHYLAKDKAVSFQKRPGYAYISGLIDVGQANIDTPVIPYKYTRAIEGVNKSDLHNTLTAETALPRQSFLRGFIDCQYRRTSDVNADPNKDYYYRNSYGRYEKLNGSDIYVRGGPYAHCLYETNPNYRKDLLEAIDFLESIVPVNNRTQVRDPNLGGDRNSYEEFEHEKDITTTVDKVWIASADQILERTRRKSGDTFIHGNCKEGNINLYGEDTDNVAPKYLVRYDYHGLTRYEPRYVCEDGWSGIRVVTRTCEDGVMNGQLLTVDLDHGARSKERAMADIDVARARDDVAYLPVLCIG